ncbi:glycosyltransferase [Patescibacteria group bacterium]|nr:glycosyltransferase [Patescibacteria group bacterium]
MRTALVYDRVNKIGGAERVLGTLHKMYPAAPLFTAVYHEKNAPWAREWDVRPSFLNLFPLARSTHELYPWLTPLAFESFDFEGFDMVINVTSAEAKGILTKPETVHLCYCLTPTQYLWVNPKLYEEAIPRILRPLARPVFSYLRHWDKIASQRPDEMIAISKTVQRRIKKHYGRDTEVIYPPVDVERFKQKETKDKGPPTNDHFLVVSRLVPYKRIDLVIDACNARKVPLIIVGTGLEMKKLKRRAGPTIQFVGKLTESELVMYYQRCRALIFPQEEDFGISVVEAQAAGKPVIAFNKGGATEIIRTGKTGIFFSRQKVASLVNAMEEFEKSQFSARVCQTNAKRFSKERFMRELRIKVEELWQEHRRKSR